MIDSHCHLNDDALYPRRQDIMAFARAAGVHAVLCLGWDVASSRKAIALSAEFPEVYAGVGIHPENIAGASLEDLREIKRLSASPKVVAIGEVGLDANWTHESKAMEAQKEWFIRQIDLANEVGLPLSIHARDAVEETYAILVAHPPLHGAVMHCFSGTETELKKLGALGFYFGFDGPVTYAKSETVKRNVALCPLDRLLTETDAPYLSPEPFRGKINEPAHIVEIIKSIAELRGEEIKKLEKSVSFNFERLFHVELKNE